jgi:anti-sigma regulatory factor (Ser/Thr protein kinase)
MGGGRSPSPFGWFADHGAVLVAPPKRRVFASRPDQVGPARRFVARVLDGSPVTDTAVLLASELATNAVQHAGTSGSETFDVIVWRGLAAACVAILDGGSDSAPVRRSPDPREPAESGYGLALVDRLATRWGHRGYDDGTVRVGAVWFLLRWSAS